MTISRLDLDGLGSPAAIASQIHALEQDLPLAVPLQSLCRQLDIEAITEIETSGFEAALIMDANKAFGSILLANGRARQRCRYSIAHELGHFLIPTHLPGPGAGFECSLADLHLLDTREQNRRRRIEAEANRFAAALLMPVPRVRANLTSRNPGLAEVIDLARKFDVSKEAMARAYVEVRREPVAIAVLRNGKIQRIYRDPHRFPWIAPRFGEAVPRDSIADGHQLLPGELSEIEECEPELWVGDRDAKGVEVITEQLLGQRDGFAMLLLHAEMAEADF